MLTLTKQTYKKDGVVTLFLHKKNFRARKMFKEKEGILYNKRSVFQEDLITHDIHLPKHTASNYGR